MFDLERAPTSSFVSMRYTLLGKTGLRVSELSLGTMTFGDNLSWGVSKDISSRILERYADAGGNFIDTANKYADGQSEEYLGELLRGRRDEFVLATKFASSMADGDLNAAGNHRKNIVGAIDASLRRLQTDHIDLLWVHARDVFTPVPEVMRALDDQVRAGKVHYVGASDWPAWEIAQANTLAELRGWSPFVATQVHYNLLERTPEREFFGMAESFDLGITAWSPLGGGKLTGKYLRGESGRFDGQQQHSRADIDEDAVVRAVVRIAEAGGWTPAQVALAWHYTRPGAVIPIVGATKESQLRDNLGALAITLDADAVAELDKLSEIALGFPHDFLREPGVRNVVYGPRWREIDDRRHTVRRTLD